MSPKTELAVAKKKEVMSAIGPVKITFENVTYTVDNGKKLGGKRVRCLHLLRSGLTVLLQTLLNNVSASFEPGTLTAIMGASGAGKTTMLNMLAGRAKRKKPFTLEGKVLVNGAIVKKKPFQQMSAYVMQVLFLHRSSAPDR